MVFTRNEYADARNKYRDFYSIIEALAITHTFLFLGCGLNDPDTRLMTSPRQQAEPDKIFKNEITDDQYREDVNE